MDVFGAMAVLGPPRKLYRVSEIADHLGVTRQTIHNYATIGLIVEEERTPGGQRLYDESVFATLARIHRLKGTHRLTQIRRLLERRPPAETAAAPASAPESGPAPAPLETTAYLAGARHAAPTAPEPPATDGARGPSPAEADMRQGDGASARAEGAAGAADVSPAETGAGGAGAASATPILPGKGPQLPAEGER